jgi:hypothetical protein
MFPICETFRPHKEIPMVARRSIHNLVQLFALALVLTVAAWSASPRATAGELDKLDTSLKLIPGDAAFYSSTLRTREQFDAVAKSNAWAKIKAMPVVQMGLAAYQMQSGAPGSGPAQIDAALKNPEARKVIDFAADMVSNELFVYGDEDFIDFLELVQDVVGAMRYGPVVLQATGQAKTLPPNQIQTRVLISALAQHADLIAVPSMVLGFKLKNVDLAKEQLIKLEMIANMVLGMNEKTKGRFKKTQLGDHQYLVLELGGDMIPWDNMPLDKFKSAEAQEGDTEKIIARLKQSKLVIALGLRDDYLLASIGSSLDCLEKLGRGDRLVDRPEFKPLEKHAAERLLSVGYVSKSLVEQANSQKKNIDDALDFVDQLLPLLKTDLAHEEQVHGDAVALAADLKTLIPDVGAVAALSFLSHRGIETYQYAWGSHNQLDGSQPLGLLDHVGGNPIFGLAARAKVSLKDYDLLVKWTKKAYAYFDIFGLPNVPAKDRETVKTFLDSLVPLLVRADKANRDLLFPALADGQLALVLDGKLTSAHFIESAPATPKPMPMVEPAIVVGVSDAKLLKQAFGEYRAVLNGLFDAIRQIEGNKLPEEVRVPEPKTAEGSFGTIYSFTLPAEWGVDKQIAPTLGVSDHVAVISASQHHTERLLKSTPLAVGGLLTKTDRPLAAAVWFNWAGLIESASPWVDLAVQQAVASKGGDENQKKEIVDQVSVVIEVLKALRSITSESYIEDQTLVHHTLMDIQDIEK